MIENLFQGIDLNDAISLKNKIIMAPMTRCMADENLVPTEAMTNYYGRRADAGLIITEAILIRPDGQGYPNTPGIFTTAQVEGWKKVTAEVHKKGGKIFAQIWHTGRIAHPYFFQSTGIQDTIAPSATAYGGTVPRMRDLTYLPPKAASLEEIEQLIKDFVQAATNAIDAGFDGVEIHGANGYLIDQFLHYDSNQRIDEYGGTPINMSRFALNIIDSVCRAIGKERTALRISPAAHLHIATDERDRDVFDYLIPELEKRELAYLHTSIFDDSSEFDYLDGSVSNYIRGLYHSTLIGVGSLNAEKGSQAIADDKFDLLAIGRPFIANPNYVELIRNGEELIEYSEEMLAILN